MDPICQAIKRGELDEVLALGGVDVERLRTGLVYALGQGLVGEAEKLVESGAWAVRKDEDWMLMVAARSGVAACLEMAIRLVGKEGVVRFGVEALEKALEKGFMVGASMLAETGLKVNVSHLCHAARGGSLEALDWVLEKGVRDAPGLGYFSALASAALFGELESMRVLLERGGSSLEENGVLAMERAAASGKLAAMEWLRERGVVPGTSVLLSAIYADNLASVRLVLDWGVDVEGGGMAIKRCAGGQATEILRLLLERGARVGLREALHLTENKDCLELLRAALG
jgi:hypothetical protein